MNGLFNLNLLTARCSLFLGPGDCAPGKFKLVTGLVLFDSQDVGRDRLTPLEESLFGGCRVISGYLLGRIP